MTSRSRSRPDRRDGLRTDPRHRAQPGRAHRAVLRAAAGGRRARAHAGDAGVAARGDADRAPAARAAVPPAAPGQRSLRRAGRAGTECRTRFVAYWSDLDQLIIPHENGRLEHADLYARNVRVHGVGHMSLPLDGQVVHEISACSAELDWDGTTLAVRHDAVARGAGVPRRGSPARCPRPDTWLGARPGAIRLPPAGPPVGTGVDARAGTCLALAEVMSASVKPRLAGRQPSSSAGCPGCRPGHARRRARQA